MIKEYDYELLTVEEGLDDQLSGWGGRDQAFGGIETKGSIGYVLPSEIYNVLCPASIAPARGSAGFNGIAVGRFRGLLVPADEALPWRGRINIRLGCPVRALKEGN